jgi:hypothetical protein
MVFALRSVRLIPFKPDMTVQMSTAGLTGQYKFEGFLKEKEE